MTVSTPVVGPCNSSSSEDRRGDINGTSLTVNNQPRNNVMLYSVSPTSVMDVLSCLPPTTMTTATKAVATNLTTHSKFTVLSKHHKRHHRRSKYRLARCSNSQESQSCPFLLAVYSDSRNNHPPRMNIRNSGNSITTTSSSRVCKNPKKQRKIHRRNHAILDFSDVFVVSAKADLNLQSHSHSQSMQPDSHAEAQT